MRRRLVSGLAAGALLLTAGPAPAGDGVRYRDPIFEVAVTTDLVYGGAMTAQGVWQDLLLDLYEPAGDVALMRPVIVWAHAGGYRRGSKADADVVRFARAFAERGWVTASINYRLRPDDTPEYQPHHEMAIDSLDGTPAAQMRDAQHDMQAAVRWFRANAATLGVDHRFIFAAGIGAGANSALETAFRPHDPGGSGNERYASHVAGVVSHSGASDPRRIKPGDPPVVMFNGTNDSSVPYPLAVLTCLGMRANSNLCEIHTYPLAGQGHDLSAHEDEIIDEAARFLCAHVAGC